MPNRTVYLVSVPQAGTRPHWLVWIPLDETTPVGIGKKIHAIGSPQFGFKVEVVHGFDYSTTKAGTKISLFALGAVDATLIFDKVDSKHETSIEMNKDDVLEKAASKVQAPRAASSELMPKGSVSEVREALKYDIAGMRRCQEWTVDYIGQLIKDKALPQSALSVITEAKKLNPSQPPPQETVEP